MRDNLYLLCRPNHKTNHHRYKILCANAIKEPCEPQKATQLILDAINLEPDQYRMGLTKVFDTFGLNATWKITLLFFFFFYFTGNLVTSIYS